MPNYKYKCKDCSEIIMVELPISFDPKIEFTCLECEGPMVRKIIVSVFPEKVGKVFVGDWFKKTYGFDMAAKAHSRKELQEDMKKAERLAKRDGINTNAEHIKKLED